MTHPAAQMISPMIKLLLKIVAVGFRETTWTEKELPLVGSRAQSQPLHGTRTDHQWQCREMVLASTLPPSLAEIPYHRFTRTQRHLKFQDLHTRRLLLRGPPSLVQQSSEWLYQRFPHSTVSKRRSKHRTCCLIGRMAIWFRRYLSPRHPSQRYQHLSRIVGICRPRRRSQRRLRTAQAKFLLSMVVQAKIFQRNWPNAKEVET